MVLTPYHAGKLVLTSGKLVACDPLVFPGTDPFAANFIPGCYPIILSLARNQEKNNPTVVYAMLRLSEQVPVRWEMATRPGECLSSLKEREVFGYGVDSGIGCFMDADAAQVLVDNNWDAETYEETLTSKLDELLEEDRSLGFMLANLCVDESTRGNVIAFTSGLGDGFYSSYFGYDAQDNIVNVVTDFCIFDSAKLI
jgi:hypothetical protein